MYFKQVQTRFDAHQLNNDVSYNPTNLSPGTEDQATCNIRIMDFAK